VNPFTFIEDAVGWLLSAFYAIWPHNLGVAIILMTAVVMAIMLPLTAKQVRSMVAMQRLQPEIKRIQQQYKDDRQKQSEEIMKFYQENEINPLSGCLPLLIQFPVWIALYRTLRDMPHHVVRSSGKLGMLYNDLCGAHNDPKHCANNSLHFLGLNLRESMFDAKKTTSFWGLIPYAVLVALAVITGIIQMRQTMARQQKSGQAQQAPPQMQSMMKIMPLFNLMTILFPAGIGLYWLSRNVWTIGQQHFVLAKYYEAHPTTPSGSSRPRPKAGAPPDGNGDAARDDAASGANAPNGTKASSAPSNNGGNGAKASAAKAAASRANPSTSKKKQQRRKR
jgi:YidC/Oxa1 family membrane protein insertase